MNYHFYIVPLYPALIPLWRDGAPAGQNKKALGQWLNLKGGEGFSNPDPILIRPLAKSLFFFPKNY
jgi:hypothetical protein